MQYSIYFTFVDRYINLSAMQIILRRPKCARTQSHRADFDRAVRADVHRNRGHPRASIDSHGYIPPMSRATRELNRPSSTSLAHLPLDMDQA